MGGKRGQTKYAAPLGTGQCPARPPWLNLTPSRHQLRACRSPLPTWLLPASLFLKPGASGPD